MLHVHVGFYKHIHARNKSDDENLNHPNRKRLRWAGGDGRQREREQASGQHTAHGRMSPPKYFDNFKRNENPLFHTSGLKCAMCVCACVSTFISYIQSAFILNISFRSRSGTIAWAFRFLPLLSFLLDSFFKLPVRYTGNKIIALDVKLKKKIRSNGRMPDMERMRGWMAKKGKS